MRPADVKVNYRASHMSGQAKGDAVVREPQDFQNSQTPTRGHKAQNGMKNKARSQITRRGKLHKFLFQL